MCSQLQMVLGSSGDGHMTPEEVERHLEARQPHYLDMDRAVATIPSEMFSNDPSLDIDRWTFIFSYLIFSALKKLSGHWSGI